MSWIRPIFLVVLLSVLLPSPAHAVIDKELKAELTKISTALSNLGKPGFFKRTASNIISTVVTGIVLHLAARWLYDHIAAKSSEKTKQSADQERLHQNSLHSFTFKNLAGHIPKDVLEITEFIKDNNKYAAMGAKMPRGILLVGPPGTGKTSIARAIAGECGAFFIAISASELIELFVGSGPLKVRDVFMRARNAVTSGAYKKAIIFIDELDSIGSRDGLENAEYRNTLNELLHQMDGFTVNDAIFVLAATNRQGVIDPALKRAGRFDRIVEIGLPDAESREAILRLYTQSIKHQKDIDFGYLARQSNGMSGADLKNIVNEAAISAVRLHAKETKQEHFEQVLGSRQPQFLIHRAL